MNYIVGFRPLFFQPPRVKKPINAVVGFRPLFFQPPRLAKPIQAMVGLRPLWRDERYGGHGLIAGTAGGIVTVGGRPAARRILCISRENFRIVRDTWSKPDGSYLLPHLNPDKDFIVLALDHEQKFEPVAWDWVRPARGKTIEEALSLAVSDKQPTNGD